VRQWRLRRATRHPQIHVVQRAGHNADRDIVGSELRKADRSPSVGTRRFVEDPSLHGVRPYSDLGAATEVSDVGGEGVGLDGDHQPTRRTTADTVDPHDHRSIEVEIDLADGSQRQVTMWKMTSCTGFSARL